MATRVVTGVDVYTWSEPDPTGAPGAKHYNSAQRGDTIEVSDTEAARGDQMVISTVAGRPIYALSKPEEADAALAQNEADAVWVGKTDDELAGMSVEQIHAYLNAVPADRSDDEIDRVIELEELRDKPRAGVLSLRSDD